MVPAPTKLSSGASTKRSGTKRLDSIATSGAADEATSRLRNLASSLPSELITCILEFAASTATDNLAKLNFLRLSKYYHDRLSPLVFSTVTLCSASTINAFAALVKGNTKIARHVCRLWIGPDSSSSDLITALSPPSYNEAAYITHMREHVHVSVRTILRACRKLKDVALAGELLSIHAAHTYGTACQPVRLTSVNPHSFVGGFSAPIFRKVRVLRIVDTNLAFEEADEIRTLAELEWLIWSAPKDYGDITRDSNVLRRLLQRPRRHFSDSQLESLQLYNQTQEIGDGQAHEGIMPHLAEETTASTLVQQPPAPINPLDELWTDLSALELNEGLAPARPSKNDKFRRLTIQTAQKRCIEFTSLLAESYPLYSHPFSPLDLPSLTDTTGGLASGLDATFQDLEREWDPALNVPTIHPTVLSGIVLDEWDALRDLINNAGGQYSNLSMWDEGEGSAVVDAGNALKRQRKVWEQLNDVALPAAALLSSEPGFTSPHSVQAHG
ncbi:uncharacterized protein MEPE_05157 [Melanopsichium pennsylvanicum]|uniref:Uncharacterized protein n=2 Tax=Melanopsichium pennsylvanicum TaxID=63383 RepID=A0AAJ4XQH0_9BASI|nr:putative protein [Melanopsichium pennsylvanicum 4]SNX86448.1 uncharacterized protein MEPE_05157 [Melanopsichium pennsylvanicum]